MDSKKNEVLDLAKELLGRYGFTSDLEDRYSSDYSRRIVLGECKRLQLSDEDSELVYKKILELIKDEEFRDFECL